MKLALISSAFFLAAAGFGFSDEIMNTGDIVNSFNNLTITNGVISFGIVVSQAAKHCLPNAQAQVQIGSSGTAEAMVISATGLSPDTGFDFFVIQVPDAPFRLAWY